MEPGQARRGVVSADIHSDDEDRMGRAAIAFGFWEYRSRVLLLDVGAGLAPLRRRRDR